MKFYHSTLIQYDKEAFINKQYYLKIPQYICDSIGLNADSVFRGYLLEDKNKLEKSDKYRIQITQFERDKHKLLYHLDIDLVNKPKTTSHVLDFIASNPRKFNIEDCKAIDAMLANQGKLELIVDTKDYLKRVNKSDSDFEKDINSDLIQYYKKNGIDPADELAANQNGKEEKKDKQYIHLEKCFGHNSSELEKIDEIDKIVIKENRNKENIIFLKNNFIYELNKYLNDNYTQKQRNISSIEKDENKRINSFYVSVVSESNNNTIQIFIKEPKEEIIKFYVDMRDDPGVLSKFIELLSNLNINLRIINPKIIQKYDKTYIIEGDISNSSLNKFSSKTIERIIRAKISAVKSEKICEDHIKLRVIERFKSQCSVKEDTNFNLINFIAYNIIDQRILYYDHLILDHNYVSKLIQQREETLKLNANKQKEPLTTFLNSYEDYVPNFKNEIEHKKEYIERSRIDAFINYVTFEFVIRDLYKKLDNNNNEVDKNTIEEKIIGPIKSSDELKELYLAKGEQYYILFHCSGKTPKYLKELLAKYLNIINENSIEKNDKLIDYFIDIENRILLDMIKLDGKKSFKQLLDEYSKIDMAIFLNASVNNNQCILDLLEYCNIITNQLYPWYKYRIKNINSKDQTRLKEKFKEIYKDFYSGIHGLISTIGIKNIDMSILSELESELDFWKGGHVFAKTQYQLLLQHLNSINKQLKQSSPQKSNDQQKIQNNNNDEKKLAEKAAVNVDAGLGDNGG